MIIRYELRDGAEAIVNFDVFGPFIIPRNKTRTLIDDNRLNELQEKAEKKMKGLSEACGCYVFAIRAAKGYTPWYVGRAKKTAIIKEAFNPTNLKNYHKVLNNKIKAGVPVMFLSPMLTESENRFRKPSEGLDAIDFLETWLIGEALRKNGELINVQKTKYLKNLRVRGIFNAKKGEANKIDVMQLRRAIW
jgi:hypothetical protein